MSGPGAALTVQQLIDLLLLVEDKSLPVKLYGCGECGWGEPWAHDIEVEPAGEGLAGAYPVQHMVRWPTALTISN